MVRPYIELWPDTLTFQHYVFALTSTQIGIWYVNSVAVAVGVTVITILSSMLCGYAISQLRFPGPDRALVADPRLVHGPDPGADHQPLRADRAARAGEHLGRHHPAAADPPGDHHRLQAVLRPGAQGLPRGGGDGQRLGVRDPLQGLPADELGGDDGALDRLLHLDLERLPLAVPVGDPDRDDDDHRRHHPGAGRLRRLLRPPARRPPSSPACRSRSPTCSSSAA